MAPLSSMAASDITLKGPVTAVAEPAIEIFGFTTLTTDDTVYENSDGLQISAGEFFVQAILGTSVELDGMIGSDNIVSATSLELVD